MCWKQPSRYIERSLNLILPDTDFLTDCLLGMITHVLIKGSTHVYRVVIKRGSPRKAPLFVDCMAQVSTTLVSGRAWTSYPAVHHGLERLSLLSRHRHTLEILLLWF